MTFIQYVKYIFTNFQWNYALEIILIACLLTWAWCYFKRRNSVWLTYIAVFGFVLVFAGALLGFRGTRVYIIMLSVACVVVPCALFATDMRRELFKMSWKDFGNTKEQYQTLTFSHDDLTHAVEAIVRACQNMSKNDVGALIVVADNISDSVLESGTTLNSLVSNELLETLFFPKSPLHDGAVIITANRIVSAGCYLPLTTRLDLPQELGTRHRAAVGISESNPTVTAIVVSEESGIISAVHDGKIIRYLDGATLTEILNYALHIDENEVKHTSIWGEHL